MDATSKLLAPKDSGEGSVERMPALGWPQPSAWLQVQRRQRHSWIRRRLSRGRQVARRRGEASGGGVEPRILRSFVAPIQPPCHGLLRLAASALSERKRPLSAPVANSSPGSRASPTKALRPRFLFGHPTSRRPGAQTGRTEARDLIGQLPRARGCQSI